MCTKLTLAFASLLLALGLVGMAAVLSSGASSGGTTEFAPASGEVTSPRDLFDIDELKSLTLDDLQWTLISERVLTSGVTETIGSWSGGVWHTFDITGTARTITLSEQAAICWPPGYPHTPNSQAGFGYVFAVHEATRLPDLADVGEQLALAFGIPVLYHGEEAVDWESLGYGSRGDLVDATVLNLFRLNRCAPVDLIRGNFGWALARTNIRAITLLQRLAEERGGSVTRVALQGGSKEGFATWLASAVDDRIEVDASGGYQREDLRSSLPVYATDWGCESPPAAEGVSVANMLILLDWITRTPAGWAAERAFSVGRFQHDLYPRFVLISGDVTRYGMHDSHHYALGMETYFLDHFTAVPWRYVRFHDPDQKGTQKLLRVLLLEQLVHDEPGYLDQVYPKVTADWVETDEANGRRFRVFATVTPEPEEVRLWWSHSDDRVWNDEENAPWTQVTMTQSTGHAWVSDWVNLQQMGVGDNEEIAYYVEAVNHLHLSYPYTATIPRRDASPVRFLWRLPENSCPISPPSWCGIYLPLVMRDYAPTTPIPTPTPTPSSKGIVLADRAGGRAGRARPVDVEEDGR